MSTQLAEARGSSKDTGSAFNYLPIGLFGSVMGIGSLSFAWRLAGFRYGLSPYISESIGLFAVATFVTLAAAYFAKVVTAPLEVLTEFRHPIAGTLFGTVPICLLQLPAVIAPLDLLAAQTMWLIGAGGMVAFAWLIVRRWMSDRQQVAHATPSWIIPIVGLLNVPVALPLLDFPRMHGLMIFALAVGLFFAIALFTIIFSRLVFEPPMPESMLPSLLILMAPFAVGSSAYAAVVGQFDLFAQSLFMLSLFFLSVLLGPLWRLQICCPFRVSWWAVGFPLSATSTAALRFAGAGSSAAADIIALALLALATTIIAMLLIRTLTGIAKGELRALSS